MLFHEREALRRIAGRLKEMFPDRIHRIYAFGSRVRGDHGEWSDLDVLVVVNGKDLEIQDEIFTAFAEEELATGIPFSPIIKEQSVFAREEELNTTFYQNIKREGVLL